jgi:hypothetical protein
MADTQPENEATAGGVGNESRPLRTDIGVAQLDVGNPRPHRNPSRCCPHQLRRCHNVVVDLGREDGVEPRIFGLARNCLHLTRTPAHARDNP